MSAPASRRERYLHWLFETSLLVKAIFALSEILAGIGAIVFTPGFISGLVATVTRAELVEDPHDLIANYLVRWSHSLSVTTQHFLALYLASHGIVKLWLILGLMRERLWYYPVALVVFGLFICYQLYRYGDTHSSWLLVITAMDLVVIALTLHEYRYLRGLRSQIP